MCGGTGGVCLAVSWSDKYNASLCFIFVTQKIKEAWMRSRGWRPVIRPARAVRIISLISYRKEKKKKEEEEEVEKKNLLQPIIINRGAGYLLLNGCGATGS